MNHQTKPQYQKIAMCIKSEWIYRDCGCIWVEKITLCEGCITPVGNREYNPPEYREGVCPDCQRRGSGGIHMTIIRSATQLLNALITPIKYLLKKKSLLQLNGNNSKCLFSFAEISLENF